MLINMKRRKTTSWSTPLKIGGLDYMKESTYIHANSAKKQAKRLRKMKYKARVVPEGRSGWTVYSYPKRVYP